MHLSARSLDHSQKREIELKARELTMGWFGELQSQKLYPLEYEAH